MPSYTPPLRDMQFVMHELLHVVDDLKAMPAHADMDADTMNAVLEEGGKFASEILFPLNMTGDAEGCQLDQTTHQVTTPKGFKEAYTQYVAGGWPALSSDPAYGGQGLPLIVNQFFYEMLNSANQAWTMYPGLTHGAYASLATHGTDAQKATYLGKMVSGEWTGTMCLTEPHCGTDLGLMRTRAEAQPDGTYRITGNKIFISAGEHDMSGNIVHLVLARLSDAPPGIKGVSLFIVPKFLVNEDGSLGERNGIYCGGLEHKMGIKGSATCQMVLDGAVGTLVGAPNKGMNGMFVMMNAARLGVGNQSLALTEVAYQNALAYAKDRQSFGTAIFNHQAVGFRLADCATQLEAARQLIWHAASLRDAGRPCLKEAAMAKLFASEMAEKVCSAAIQTLGGYGYVSDFPLERIYRDVRVCQIYEGTSDVQKIIIQRSLAA